MYLYYFMLIKYVYQCQFFCILVDNDIINSNPILSLTSIFRDSKIIYISITGYYYRVIPGLHQYQTGTGDGSL